MAEAGAPSRVSHHILVRCRDNPEPLRTNIYALRGASTYLASVIDIDDYDTDLDAPYDGFEVFTTWLSNGEVEYFVSEDHDCQATKVLCKAYETGKELRVSSCFLDDVLDDIVQEVTRPGARHRATDIVETLMETFEADTPGWEFLADWLVHGDMSGEGVLDFASGSMIAKIIEDDEDLLSAFLERHFHEKVCPTVGDPWDADCAYHGHGADEPCYQNLPGA